MISENDKKYVYSSSSYFKLHLCDIDQLIIEDCPSFIAEGIYIYNGCKSVLFLFFTLTHKFV